MIARFVMLMFVAVLALPVATLTRPTETSPSPWGDVAVEAKGKKHRKGKNKQPKVKTVRQQITRTFASTEPITINSLRHADPYPSAIAVSGFANGTVTDVNLNIDDLTHASPNDVDILLSTSDGRRALVMSDVDNRMGNGVADLDLTLDDEAAASLPARDQGDELKSGTYRPTDHADNADTFEPPAPEPNGSVALSAFDGANPNATWHVWVMDNVGGGAGDIAGWSLQITAEVDVLVKVKPKKHRKGNGRHERR